MVVRCPRCYSTRVSEYGVHNIKWICGTANENLTRDILIRT